MSEDRCERCCFYEHCTKSGRTETKNCVYGKKEAADGGTNITHGTPKIICDNNGNYGFYEEK